jgi:hypothetical protein
VHHQPGAGLRAVEQVGGGVVGEGFALAVQVVLAGDDAAGGVVVQQLVAGVALVLLGAPVRKLSL